MSAANAALIRWEDGLCVPQAAGATPPLHGAMIIKPLQGLGRLRR
jgi:hypothetical protein